MTLAREEHPDTSRFDDPEVAFRADEAFHAGLVLRSPSLTRLEELMDRYTERLAREYKAVLPPADRPVH
jgi:hypothetical protein